MKILLKEHKRKDGSFLGEAILNRPEALNAMDQDMASNLRKALKRWKNDSRVRFVFLHSQSPKAFCSGGDVKSLYYKIVSAENQNRDPGLAVQPFFEQEYSLNYLIRVYPKPIIVWGQGLVMGGGFGLLSGASHPIVTESSILAMPEIKIGFFSDVGSGYFLNRLPHDMGWYLGLTGCSFNGAEFLYLGMGELCLKNSDKEKVLQFLLSGSFKGKRELTEQLKFHFGKKSPPLPPNRLKPLVENVRQLTEKKNLWAIFDKIQSLPATDPFWDQNKEAFLKGSPSSLGVICEQLKRGEKKTLKEVFQMEMVMALQFARHADFPEGIRALLVEKTNSPKWKPSSIKKIKSSWIKEHFEAFAGWTNPLDSL